MTFKKSLFLLLAMCLLLSLCGYSDAGGPAQTDAPGTDAPQVQYDYQLKAGEDTEVYDMTFEKMVTVTVDPASTRDGSNDVRSSINFDGCTFNGGLTVVGDYHAIVSLGEDCFFSDGSVVTCKEASSGISREITLDDNFIKVFIACDGVTVETESAIGVLSDGPDFVFNGTVYSKTELAPDTAYLGVYSVYEDDSMEYIKLAIGEDDSVEFLN